MRKLLYSAYCGCPSCSSSKGEKAIAEYFDVQTVQFERQKRFESCRIVFTLPFDFYVPAIHALIEYQGAHHYKPILYGKTQEHKQKALVNFGKRKRNDRFKKNWARRNGYRLIVIPYTVKDIAGFLQKKLGMGAALPIAA